MWSLGDIDDVVSARPDAAVARLELTDPGDHVALPLVVLVEPLTLELCPDLPFSRREELNET